MRYIDEKKIMKYDDVEYILRFVRKNIFTFQLTDDNYVEVEFLNTDGKISSNQNYEFLTD